MYIKREVGEGGLARSRSRPGAAPAKGADNDDMI